MIVHLWCCPRTLSTATMYSFAQRPDTLVFDEPLYASYLNNNPEVSRPYKDKLLQEQEKDGKLFLETLPSKFTSTKSIIICKHIAKQIDGIDLNVFIGPNIKHVFLIRDPLDIINSWNDRQHVHNEPCSLEALCFTQMVQLFSYFRRKTSNTPITIDSNLLRIHPREILTSLCHKLNIPFYESQLSWEPGPKPHIDGLWASYWYEQVHKSSGFNSYIDDKSNQPYFISPDSSLTPRSAAPVSGLFTTTTTTTINTLVYPTLSAENVELYREALPFYELLIKHALGKDILCPHTSIPEIPLIRSIHDSAHTTPRGSSSTHTASPGHTNQLTRSQSHTKPKLVYLADVRNENILIWIGDKLYPRECARISVFDSTVQGGDAVWEGLRIYHNKIFKLHEHLDRLYDSAKALHFQYIPSRTFIIQAILKTLQVNGMYDNVDIRMTLSRGIKITSSMNPYFNIFGTTLILVPEWKPPINPTTYDNDKGIILITASNRRHSSQCLDSKIHHNNLLNNIIPKIQANNAHAQDAIMLDLEGFVSETNATNIFMVKGKILYTPTADSCLPGITRQTVIEIAKELNIVCIEKRLSLTEFYTADEVFTTGTMGELTPVTCIDGRQICSTTTNTSDTTFLLPTTTGIIGAIGVDSNTTTMSTGEERWPIYHKFMSHYRQLTKTEGYPIPHPSASSSSTTSSSSSIASPSTSTSTH